MPRQLDILALEPYFGGVRKQTLELLSRHSRHRWTVYKLPARRLERRLSTAAQWFTQQLRRVPNVRCDVIFASDALNLAEFLRLNPRLSDQPSVAYFYCNQLTGETAADQQSRLTVLSTASCATEIWFNSFFHMGDFLAHAAATFDSHKELAGTEPLRALVTKSQLIHPPVEIASPDKDSGVVDAERKGRNVCLDNRDGALADVFVAVLKEIAARKEPVAVHVLGRPLHGIPDEIPAIQVDTRNDIEVIRTLRICEFYISAHPCAEFDPMAMRAMVMGCIPILRREGFYREFLPEALQPWCLYDGQPAELLSRIMDLWYLRRPAVARKDLDTIFNRYTPIQATRNFDRRLDYLADQSPSRK